MLEALQSRKKLRLGKVKQAARRIFNNIPSFNNPVRQSVTSEIIEKCEDYTQLAQYTLYNIFYGSPQPTVDPGNKHYMKVVKLITRMLNEHDDVIVKGVALGTLGNLGSYAVRHAMNSARPDPVLSAVGSKHPFLKACAKFAMECNPPNQPEGKPKLQAKELKTVRMDMGHDVPAYQESEHYDLMGTTQAEDKDGKKSGIIIPGQ